MLDLVYQTLLTILAKDEQGRVSPLEFNQLANTVQSEIFRGYFEEENLDKNKQNAGITNKGHSNLPFIQRQRIQQFAEVSDITLLSDKFTLPNDLYLIEDDGVVTATSETHSNKVVEEVERGRLNYLVNSISKPTILYPVYERYNDYIIVSPTIIQDINIKYLRKPKVPNWTYFTLPTSEPSFNPSDIAFQDFDLHESEFSNIVIMMLTYFGINLREADVVKVAEILKNKMNLKDNG